MIKKIIKITPLIIASMFSSYALADKNINDVETSPITNLYLAAEGDAVGADVAANVAVSAFGGALEEAEEILRNEAKKSGVPESVQNQIKDVMTSEPRGIAYVFVKQLFGGWVADLFSDTASTTNVDKEVTLITRVAGMTNVLALIIGVTIIGYVMLAGVLNTASTGQVLGKSWSTLWLPIRTALAFGLIMPMGAVDNAGSKDEILAQGYLSPIQTGVIYLSLVGSNAGDMVWNEAIDAMATGAPLVAKPASIKSGRIADIANMASCGYYASYSQTLRAQAKGLSKTDKELAAFTVIYKTDPNTGNQTYEYVNYKMLDSGAWKPKSNEVIKKITFGTPDVLGYANEACGTIEFPQYMAENPKTMDYIKSKISQGVATSIVGFVQNLGSSNVLKSLNESPSNGGLGGVEGMAALAYLDAGAGSASSKEQQEIQKNIQTISETYKKLILDLSVNMDKSIESSIASGSQYMSNYKQLFGQGGWASAGMWFFQLSKFSGMASAVVDKTFSEMTVANFDVNPASCNGVKAPEERNLWNRIVSFFNNDTEEKTTAALCTDDGFKAYATINAIHSKAIGTIRDTMPNEEDMDAFANNEDTGLFSFSNAGFSTSIAWGLLEAASSAGSYGTNVGGDEADGEDTLDDETTNVTGSMSPFRVLTGIGHFLNGITAAAGLGYIAVQLFELSGGNVAKTASNLMGLGEKGSEVLEKGGVMIGMLTAIIVSLLVGQGFILAYVIPFTPIIIWTMLVIGWLVMLIEAVIAAPLAVILMSTPEGEGISGSRMERALSLTSAVIMRPALSIIGLIAATTMSFLGFAIWNMFFWRVAEITTGIGLFEIVAIMTMYVTGAMGIIKYTFSLIHVLPNNILEWMHGQQRAFGENEAGQTASDGAKGVAGASGKGFSAAGGYIRDARDKKKVNIMEKEKKNQMDVSNNTTNKE